MEMIASSRRLKQLLDYIIDAAGEPPVFLEPWEENLIADIQSQSLPLVRGRHALHRFRMYACREADAGARPMSFTEFWNRSAARDMSSTPEPLQPQN
jgi:hypothetical protein